MEDFWTNRSHFNSYEISLEFFSLFNGDQVYSDLRVTHIIDNHFSGNFRGTNTALVYLERTPYFEIRSNRFLSNSILYLVGQLTSLDDFVERMTGLAGVSSLGDFTLELNESLRMFPLIFSNLGLTSIIEDNEADSNPVSAGVNYHDSGCASAVEFFLLGASTLHVQSFSILRPTTQDYKFLEEFSLSLKEDFGDPVTIECSLFRFDIVSADTLISFDNL